MLHPLLVDYLIERYVERSHSVILDPFCGSGVTLLQGILRGHDVIGLDINPIALLICDAKTTIYDADLLRKEFDDLRRSIVTRGSMDIPQIRNIDIWYDPSVVADLGRIRHVLKKRTYHYSSFFTACFAFVCRNQSFTRNGEFKRYRVQQAKRESMKNEVLPVFISHTGKMMEEFLRDDLPNRSSILQLQDVESHIPSELNADMILTSPPYGDSGTTVAYEQYTSFGYEWTCDLTPKFRATSDYHKLSLGNKKDICDEVEQDGILMETVARVREADPKRALDVLRFFNGYRRTLTNIYRRLRIGGCMCFVVGNRTVKGVEIPMDQISASFMEGLGLTLLSISVRELSNKVMPSRNSPTNVKGLMSKTMSKEYIVVCRRDV